MKKFLSKTMLRGLSIVVPFAVAAYVMAWVVGTTERALRGVLELVLPEGAYIPGMGLLVVVLGVFICGLLMYPWVTRKLMDHGDELLRRIPIFGAVYSPIKDLMNLLGGGFGKHLGAPVMVKVPNTDMETLAFITCRDGAELPPGMLPEDHVVVFVQWSSQLGGYCFVVPRDSVRELDITVEEGMRWALTAGLSAPKGGAARLSEKQEQRVQPEPPEQVGTDKE